eukprot:6022396-Pyramimonas_sp.AAC.2
MSALRAAYSHDVRHIRQALARYPRLAVHFDNDANCTRVHGLCQHVFCLYKKILDAGEIEISQCDAEEVQPRSRVARLRRRQSLWRKFRRRAVLGSVLDSTGSPSSTLPEAARLLRDHWSEVFKAPSVDQELLDEVKPFIQYLGNLTIMIGTRCCLRGATQCQVLMGCPTLSGNIMRPPACCAPDTSSSSQIASMSYQKICA